MTVRRWVGSFGLGVGLWLFVASFAGQVRAEPLDAALARFATEDAVEIKLGIAELGKLADARALEALMALRDGKLQVERAQKRVYRQHEGQLRDLLTGRPPAAGAALVPLAVSNVLRRDLGPVIAVLELRALDRETRLAAAQALLTRPLAELNAELRAALARESDAEVHRLLALAVATVDLESRDPKERLAAVSLIAEAADLSFKPKLERLTSQDSQGAFLEPDAAVRAAAQRAVADLELRELLIRVLGDFLYGLSLASVLLLAALGLAITFGLMGVINMAHGEMLMLGAYAAYTVQTLFQRFLPDHLDWYLPVALPVAFAFCGAVGMLLERTVLRFLYGRPLETLLSTWGISLLLIQTVRLTFGAQNVAVALPSWLSGGYEAMQGVVLPYSRLAIIAFGAVVVSFVWFLLSRTRLGLDVRAVTQNRPMASSMGISTARVDMWTFGIGSGVAGLGGVALSQIGNVGPELGQGYIVDSFMVVVLGGVGKLAGTIAGSLGLGVVNKLLEPVSGAVLGKILVLGFLILFIQKRPQGIFALKGRAVEG